MAEMTPEDIENVINKVLDKRRGEDIDHKADHAFIRMLEERERRKKEIWDKVKAQVFGWGIIAIVGTIGAWVVSNLHIK